MTKVSSTKEPLTLASFTPEPPSPPDTRPLAEIFRERQEKYEINIVGFAEDTTTAIIEMIRKKVYESEYNDCIVVSWSDLDVYINLEKVDITWSDEFLVNSSLKKAIRRRYHEVLREALKAEKFVPASEFTLKLLEIRNQVLFITIHLC